MRDAVVVLIISSDNSLFFYAKKFKSNSRSIFTKMIFTDKKLELNVWTFFISVLFLFAFCKTVSRLDVVAKFTKFVVKFGSFDLPSKFIFANVLNSGAVTDLWWEGIFFSLSQAFELGALAVTKPVMLLILF